MEFILPTWTISRYIFYLQWRNVLRYYNGVYLWELSENKSLFSEAGLETLVTCVNADRTYFDCMPSAQKAIYWRQNNFCFYINYTHMLKWSRRSAAAITSLNKLWAFLLGYWSAHPKDAWRCWAERAAMDLYSELFIRYVTLYSCQTCIECHVSLVLFVVKKQYCDLDTF